jgi:hypothetical protein
MGAAVVFVATFGSVIFARVSTTKTGAEQAMQPRQPLSPSEQSDFGVSDTDGARQLGICGVPITGNWGNPGNGGAKRVLSQGEALLDVTRRLATGETIDAQNDLAEMWGVDKSTVSKWLKRWRADALVPIGRRVGRCQRLALA